jgi:uncharacterized protein with FMN-binding domain
MSLATTAGLAGLFATMGQPAAQTAAVIVSGGNATQPVGAAAVGAAPVGAAPAGTAAASAPTRMAASSPTVVDGAVVPNRWGPVQVEATFAPDGSLTEVVAIQTPDNRSKSVRINARAVPRLTSEALAAQSAAVHTVSGATYTSDGYRDSLQSAIDAARAAGVTAIA